MIKKGKLNLILGIFVLFLWGFIGFRVISGLFGGEDSEVITEKIESDSVNLKGKKNEGKKEQFVYTSLKRDPFYFGKIPRKRSIVTAANENKVSTPQILFKLIGIVTDDVENLAIIEEGNTTKFLRAGDTVGELKIKKVEKDRIILSNGESVLIK